MAQPMEPLTRRRVAAVVFAAALLVSGAANAQSPGGGLSNLFGNIFSGPNSASPGPSQTLPGGGGPLPWSGEDGASGHPLMTARAIRQAAANFDNCVASMWSEAARRNISQENF